MLSGLSKYIQQELLPAQNENNEGDTGYSANVLPLETVETAIKSIANRVNYGIEIVGSTRVPASLCVWRWEVKPENYEWLPKNSREKVDARLAERLQVSLIIPVYCDV